MLTDTNYGGYYQDEDISVSIELDDPMRYDFESNRLVFKVSVSSRDSATQLHKEDFMFYLMTDDNRIHNMEFAKFEAKKLTGNEHPCSIFGVMHAGFDPAYLFQGLRIAMYYQPDERIEVIDLKFRFD